MKENEAIEHPMITQAVEKAQRKVEGHNFDIRKQLLEYDNVANEQRKIIYAQRDELMAAENISDTINAIREDVVNAVISSYVPPNSLEEQWDINGLEKQLYEDFGLQLPIHNWLHEDDSLHEVTLKERILQAVNQAYQEKEKMVGEDMRQLEKSIMLQSLDMHWKEHLAAMDHLREGIHLRGYAQQNPKQEYKREAFKMFTEMLESLKHTVMRLLFSVRIRDNEDIEEIEEQRRQVHEQEVQKLNFLHNEMGSVLQQSSQNADASGSQNESVINKPFERHDPKVGRNDQCPCGSGKKYKQCCGRI